MLKDYYKTRLDPLEWKCWRNEERNAKWEQFVML
jgi:hypothetical protein